MLGIFLAVGVFHDHKLQQETDGRVRLHGKMNVLIGKAIGLWLEKKAEQRRIRVNNGEIVTEKGIPLNQNANDNDFFLIGSRSAQGIATIWLPDNLKASGRVKHIGISFHGTPEMLDDILTKHPEIEIVQIQANYYDHNTDAARRNGGSVETYEVCCKHDKPMIIAVT